MGSEERAPPARAGAEKPLLRALLGLIDKGMDDKVMLSVERMPAERACERIIVDFIHRLDLGDPSSVAELFTPDGVWHWPFGDRRIEGPARLLRLSPGGQAVTPSDDEHPGHGGVRDRSAGDLIPDDIPGRQLLGGE